MEGANSAHPARHGEIILDILIGREYKTLKAKGQFLIIPHEPEPTTRRLLTLLSQEGTNMRKLIFSVGLLLLCAAPASSASHPTGELFGGFSYFNFDTPSLAIDFYGGQASVSANFNEHVGITGDFGAQFRSGVQLYQFLVGPRFTARNPNVTAFAHTMIGTMHTRAGGFSSTDLALAFGGGLDVNVNKHVAVRAFQLDYIPIHPSGTWVHNFRAAVGVVFKWGAP